MGRAVRYSGLRVFGMRHQVFNGQSDKNKARATRPIHAARAAELDAPRLNSGTISARISGWAGIPRKSGRCSPLFRTAHCQRVGKRDSCTVK
eukprot:3134701-Alexandrium_andersonii.AAC.1